MREEIEEERRQSERREKRGRYRVRREVETE